MENLPIGFGMVKAGDRVEIRVNGKPSSPFCVPYDMMILLKGPDHG